MNYSRRLVWGSWCDIAEHAIYRSRCKQVPASREIRYYIKFIHIIYLILFILGFPVFTPLPLFFGPNKDKNNRELCICSFYTSLFHPDTVCDRGVTRMPAWGGHLGMSGGWPLIGMPLPTRKPHPLPGHNHTSTALQVFKKETFWRWPSFGFHSGWISMLPRFRNGYIGQSIIIGPDGVSLCNAYIMGWLIWRAQSVSRAINFCCLGHTFKKSSYLTKHINSLSSFRADSGIKLKLDRNTVSLCAALLMLWSGVRILDFKPIPEYCGGVVTFKMYGSLRESTSCRFRHRTVFDGLFCLVAFWPELLDVRSGTRR